jgi:hypothetical protein
MSDTDKSELVDMQIEHCIGELIGIVKHTESFENEPEKKARQLERNKSMAEKSKQTIKALITQQCHLRELYVLEHAEAGDDEVWLRDDDGLAVTVDERIEGIKALMELQAQAKEMEVTNE